VERPLALARFQANAIQVPRAEAAASALGVRDREAPDQQKDGAEAAASPPSEITRPGLHPRHPRRRARVFARQASGRAEHHSPLVPRASLFLLSAFGI
jgi:hypothetical protein